MNRTNDYRLSDEAINTFARRHGLRFDADRIERFIPRMPRHSWKGTPERAYWRRNARNARLAIGQPERRTGANAGSLAGTYGWNRRYFPTGSGPGMSSLMAFRRSYKRLAGPAGILP